MPMLPLQIQLKGLASVISKAGYTIAGVTFIAFQMNIGKGDVENYVLPYSSNGNNILFAAKILHSYDECIINELRRLTLLTMQKQYLLTQMFI